MCQARHTPPQVRELQRRCQFNGKRPKCPSHATHVPRSHFSAPLAKIVEGSGADGVGQGALPVRA